MAVQLSYPGVYIDEVQAAQPIKGVGTSTAAFAGVATKGPLDTPMKITSWVAFQSTFGDPVPGFYLWYAVRGFFENGGQVCYVVRVSNGTYGSVAIANLAAHDMATVAARNPGNQEMSVEIVSNPHLASDLAVYQPTGALAGAPTGKELTFSDANEAARFRPGDIITCDSSGDRVTVARVTGSVVRVAEDLLGSYAGTETFRLADIAAGARTVRLVYMPSGTNAPIPSGSLQTGSVLSFAYQTGETHVVESVQTEYLANGEATYRVTLRDGFGSLLGLTLGSTVTSNEFDVKVTLSASTTTYARLSADSAHPAYYVDVLNGDAAGLVSVTPLSPPPADPLASSLPQVDVYALPKGDPEDLSSLASTDFVDAIATLETVDDVNLLSVPDCIALKDSSGNADAAAIAIVQQETIAHCERMYDRFAVLDAQPGLVLFSTGTGDSIEDQRRGLDSTRGYAALYYPWLQVAPSGAGDPILVPPSGHVCGVFSRSDQQRGVHKAPANEIVAGALGVERSMSNIDHGQINLQGINVIRTFAGGRPVLWGARTTATDTNWQYVNIRRLFLFIEESLEEGFRWAVFEPNNLQLWQKLKRTINEFLNRIWKDGALFGATAEEAYYVKIDTTNNTPYTMALGELHIEVGLRPAYPAEFIVVHIGIWQGGAQISES
jgi:phage tail sheath protein FI